MGEVITRQHTYEGQNPPNPHPNRVFTRNNTPMRGKIPQTRILIEFLHAGKRMASTHCHGCVSF
jgi:hypothetical protein